MYLTANLPSGNEGPEPQIVKPAIGHEPETPPRDFIFVAYFRTLRFTNYLTLVAVPEDSSTLTTMLAIWHDREPLSPTSHPHKPISLRLIVMFWVHGHQH